MTHYEILPLLISLLAASIAVVSLVRTRRVNNRQLELQTKQTQLQEEHLRLNQRHEELASKVAQFQIREYEEAELAKKEAKIAVTLESTHSPNIYHFIFRNEGRAPTHKVSWTIESKTGGAINFDNDFPKEIGRLDPGSSMTLRASWDRNVRSPFIAYVSWYDAEGKRFTQDFELYT